MLNRKCTICRTSKLFREIRSAYKPFFHRYLPIGCAYSTHRRLELEIWRFSCRRRQRQQQTYKPIALPLAHARGVKIITPSSLTFQARGLERWSGRLQTLLQPVRLLCHSHRGPKSAYGGLPGFIQDGGYSREEPGRPLSHNNIICPGPCAVFSCGCQRGYR